MTGKTITIFLIVIIYFIPKTHLFASIKQSFGYQLKLEKITVRNKDQSSLFSIETILSQKDLQFFLNNGYFIKSNEEQLEFILSNTSLNFQTSNERPLTKTTKIIASSSNNKSEILIKAIVDKALTNLDQTEKINHTTCDNKEKLCTPYKAQVWISETAYGFGYQIFGTDAPYDFINKSYFRPFADISRAEKPALILTSETNSVKTEGDMAIKINPPPFVKKLNYQTTINFLIITSL